MNTEKNATAPYGMPDRDGDRLEIRDRARRARRSAGRPSPMASDDHDDHDHRDRRRDLLDREEALVVERDAAPRVFLK